MVCARVRDVRRQPRVRGRGVQRVLALAIETGIRRLVFVEAHHEAAAPRTHEEAAIDLAAADDLLRIRSVAVLAAGDVRQQLGDHAGTCSRSCAWKRRRQVM